VVRTITGASLAHSPLSLNFALQILQTLKQTLAQAGRSINLDLRVDSPLLCEPSDVDATAQQQLESAGKLHACVGAGTLRLTLARDTDASADALIDLLQWTWESTGVVRMQVERAVPYLLQGQLPI